MESKSPKSGVETHGVKKGAGNKSTTKLPTTIKMAVVRWCKANGIVYNHETESFVYNVSGMDVKSKKTGKDKTLVRLYANYFKHNGQDNIIYANNSKKLSKPVRLNLTYHLAAENYLRKLIDGRFFQGEDNKELKKLFFNK